MVRDKEAGPDKVTMQELGLAVVVMLSSAWHGTGGLTFDYHPGASAPEPTLAEDDTGFPIASDRWGDGQQRTWQPATKSSSEQENKKVGRWMRNPTSKSTIKSGQN